MESNRESIVVLTGARVSADSGLATFRGAGGLWEGHRVEDVATPRAFQRDPQLVWRFYNLRRANLATVKPNSGHLALVELENRVAQALPSPHRGRGVGDEGAVLAQNFTLVTQNV